MGIGAAKTQPHHSYYYIICLSVLCMWIYMYMHINMYMYLCAYMCVNVCAYTNVHMCVKVCVCVSVCTCVYVNEYMCVCICVYVCKWIGASICECVCVCMCLWMIVYVNVCVSLYLWRRDGVIFTRAVCILILKSEQGPQDNPPLWVSSVSQHEEEPSSWLPSAHLHCTWKASGDFQSSGSSLSASRGLSFLVRAASSFCPGSWDCYSMLCCVCFSWIAKCALALRLLLEKSPGREETPWSLHSVRRKAEYRKGFPSFLAEYRDMKV